MSEIPALFSQWVTVRHRKAAIYHPMVAALAMHDLGGCAVYAGHYHPLHDHYLLHLTHHWTVLVCFASILE
jgi:hypothetical protein